MKTVNIPGFTADASLYEASEHYQQLARGTGAMSSRAGILPALIAIGGLSARCCQKPDGPCASGDKCTIDMGRCVCTGGKELAQF
jgi:hypothetical protein